MPKLYSAYFQKSKILWIIYKPNKMIFESDVGYGIPTFDLNLSHAYQNDSFRYKPIVSHCFQQYKLDWNLCAFSTCFIMKSISPSVWGHAFIRI